MVMNELIRKILKEETSLKDNLIGKINKLGVASVIKLMGGYDNIVKIFGDDSVGLIYKFLEEKYTPDYGWDTFEHYDDEVASHGIYKFTVNDELMYQYTEYGNGETLLYIFSDAYDEMEDIFGVNELWLPIFKNWFENNTGLKVYRVE
jgi:hypothetical protein